MTKQLLQKALDALETNQYAVADAAPHADVMAYNDAITALRSALAAPIPEPVAWLWLDQDGYTTIQTVKPYHDAEPLYAAPPAAPMPEPSDMVMVPMEPTPEMIEAGESVEDLYRRGTPHTWKAVYRAMIAAAPPAAPAPVVPEMETRADGKLVRVDRWEWGIRRIVALLWGNRKEFEIEEVVQAIKELVPYPHEDDESLCTAVERLSAAPVVPLTDERAAFEAWHEMHRTQPRTKFGDTYENAHVRARWEGWQARALQAIHAAIAAAPVVPLTDEQISMIVFLLGAGPLDGVWFGDNHPTERGAFWWRKHLRRLFPSDHGTTGGADE